MRDGNQQGAVLEGFVDDAVHGTVRALQIPATSRCMTLFAPTPTP